MKLTKEEEQMKAEYPYGFEIADLTGTIVKISEQFAIDQEDGKKISHTEYEMIHSDLGVIFGALEELQEVLHKMHNQE